MSNSALLGALRKLLAAALSYALILQSSLLPAQASARLALANALPSDIRVLCSSAQAPDETSGEAAEHHLSGRSSCCVWSISVGLDPFTTPHPPVMSLRRVLEVKVQAVALVDRPRGSPLRTFGANGSRAPPTLGL